ncbi:MAG: hypothetical protein J7K22_02860 [Nanoarchaeota archaeon]|nr:hypothetical protein [Nanoarchaeota archaeon]
MKRAFVFAIMFLFLFSVAFAKVNVRKEMPLSVEYENTINVSIELKSDKNIGVFDFVEFLPKGWKIDSWTVYNYDKDRISYDFKTLTYLGKEREAFHWRFEDGLGLRQVVLVYTITPKQAGNHEIISVWTYPGEFESSTNFMTVLPKKGVVFCGNGICELGETSITCPNDCPRVEVEVYDITPILTGLLVVFGIAVVGYIYYRHIKRITHVRERIEDLRAFIKLGLKRGYTLREMVNALKGAGVKTDYIEKMMEEEEFKQLENGIKRKRKVYPEDEIIQKIKKVVEELKEEDVFKELGIRRL